MACSAIGIKFSTLPPPVLLPMVLVGGMVAGALWAGVAGVVKGTVGAHGVVTTIMMNYVAQWVLRYLIMGGPVQLAAGTSKSLPIGPGARLATLLPSDNSLIVFGLPASVYRVHTGLFIALVAVAVFAFLLWRTTLGYEIRAVGHSQRAARYAGVSVRRTIIVTMLIAGAFPDLTAPLPIPPPPPSLDHRKSLAGRACGGGGASAARAGRCHLRTERSGQHRDGRHDAHGRLLRRRRRPGLAQPLAGHRGGHPRRRPDGAGSWRRVDPFSRRPDRERDRDQHLRRRPDGLPGQPHLRHPGCRPRQPERAAAQLQHPRARPDPVPRPGAVPPDRRCLRRADPPA